jgi:negative regulator of replication initiation
MKTIDVSDEVYEALQRLAAELQQSPADVLASLLRPPTGAPATESIVAFVLGPSLRAKANHADQYLALLGWIAAQHSPEFTEFIRSEIGSSRFLNLGRDEVVETCRRNFSCQIEGTQYWAVMNIDDAMKRRFIARVLEFIGYREAAIELATTAIGLGPVRRGRFGSLVA